jgi:pimeloyl-ACP methyl ester carboxylesterase
VDLPGFGYSDKPGGYSLERYVAFLRAWLDLHCIDTAAVMGNSMGGLITAAFAAMAPERVAAAVLLDPAGFGRDARMVMRFTTLRILRGLIHLRFTPRRVRHAFTFIYGNPDLVEDEDIERVVRLSELPNARAGMIDIGRHSLGLRGYRPAMGLGEVPHDITRPTLIVWGDRDRVIPISHAHLVQEAAPGSRLVVFEGVGHVPQLEAPERLMGEVLPFLAAHHPPDREESAS